MKALMITLGLATLALNPLLANDGNKTNKDALLDACAAARSVYGKSSIAASDALLRAELVTKIVEAKDFDADREENQELVEKHLINLELKDFIYTAGDAIGYVVASCEVLQNLLISLEDQQKSLAVSKEMQKIAKSTLEGITDLVNRKASDLFLSENKLYVEELKKKNLEQNTLKEDLEKSLAEMNKIFESLSK